MFGLIEDDEVFLVTAPGWGSSGAQHWQTRWEKGYPLACRAEMPDWFAPERGPWLAALTAAIAACPGRVVVAAHSLGCHTAVDWVLSLPLAERKRAHGLLLVAPPALPILDEAASDAGVVPAGTPLMPFSGFDAPRLQRLPCPAIVVASRNDPFCPFAEATQMAAAWGARLIDAGDAGHLGDTAGLGAWPAGQKLLQQLMLG
ncbi:RBBP9/YdeN family alpha/beta hydrolase [Crenobacter caeni]|uniref:RBBP9/YdeN family alpha/beta hydrolase n=1 Tax=Crenobacter caeni TaxID=2705474 RepID=UPI001EF33DCF|nr:alpha/beta hydrolase [Crenobacter caeni]